MTQHDKQLAPVLLVAVTAVFAGLAYRESSRVYAQLFHQSETQLEDLMLQTTATTPDGVQVLVTTTPGQGVDPNGQPVPSGESAQDALARHLRWVRLIEGTYTPPND